MLRMGHQRGRQIMSSGRVRLSVRTAHDGRIMILFQRWTDIPVSKASRRGTGRIVERDRVGIGGVECVHHIRFGNAQTVGAGVRSLAHVHAPLVLPGFAPRVQLALSRSQDVSNASI